jgi:hypothetical protein
MGITALKAPAEGNTGVSRKDVLEMYNSSNSSIGSNHHNFMRSVSAGQHCNYNGSVPCLHFGAAVLQQKNKLLCLDC